MGRAVRLGLFLGCAFVAASCSTESSVSLGEPEGDAAAISSPAVTVSGYEKAVKDDVPKGWWRLGDKTTPVAFDSSLTPHPGTYFGAPVLDVPGALAADSNGAARFSPNTTDYVSIPHDAATQAPAKLTIEAWATIPGSSFSPSTNAAPIIKTSSQMGDGYGFYYTPYAIHFYINRATPTTKISYNLTVGPKGARSNDTTQSRAHHFVGTYDGQVMHFYVDGSEVGTGLTLNEPLNAGTGPLKIGQGWAQNSGWFGMIDEVAIYDKVLPLARVKAHFKAALGTPNIDELTAGTTAQKLYGQKVYTVNPRGRRPLWDPVGVSVTNGYASYLATRLTGITGQTFTFEPMPASGANPEAIQLIRWCTSNTTMTCVPERPYPGTPSARELTMLSELNTRDALAFGVLSEEGQPGLKIISRSDNGLAMGIGYYLRLLGSRWILPNDHWKIVTERQSIRWNTYRVESPDFRYGISYFGSGVAHPEYPGVPHWVINPAQTWGEWNLQNQLLSGLNCRGHYGSTFIVEHQAAFEAHPQWPAWDGGRNPVPLTYSNGKLIPNFGWHVPDIPSYAPQFQTFMADESAADISKWMGATQYNDSMDPDAMCASVEPMDGAVEDASPEARGLGSPSDNLAILANVTAKKFQTVHKGRHAGYMAYGGHLAVPSVVLEPNVAVTVSPYAFNLTSSNVDGIVQAWKNKHANIGVYDYWGSNLTSMGTPAIGAFSTVPQKMRYWKESRFSQIGLESGQGAGSMGLAFYEAGRLAWDTRLADAEEQDSTFTFAFGASGSGPARTEMEALLRRWNGFFSLTRNELGLTLASLTAALGPAQQSGGTPGGNWTCPTSDPLDPKIRARIFDFVAYAHYLVLYSRYLENRTEATADALLSFMWRINDRNMVEGAAIAKFVLDDKKTSGWSPVGVPPVLGPKWAALQSYLQDECTLRQILHDDLAAYPVLYTPRSYPGALTPIPGQPAGSPNTIAVTHKFTGTGRTFAFVATAPRTFQFNMRLPVSPITYRVVDPTGIPVPVTTTAGTGAWAVLSFTAAVAGTYVMTVDLNTKTANIFELAVPTDQRFVVLGGNASTDINAYTFPTEANTQPWSAFYVPSDSTGFAIVSPSGFAPTPIPGQPGLRLRIPGEPGTLGCDTPSGEVRCYPNNTSPTYLVVTVSSTRRGKIWALSSFKILAAVKGDGVLFLDNIPNVFAYDASQLVTPSCALTPGAAGCN